MRLSRLPEAAQAWFKQARSDLKRGGEASLLDKMQALSNNSLGEHGNYDLPNQLFYQGAAGRTVELFSGGDDEVTNWPRAIESLIRQVVNLRLKGNGKFWLLENAEAMLHARAPVGSGCLVNFLQLYPDGYPLSSLTPLFRVAPLASYLVLEFSSNRQKIWVCIGFVRYSLLKRNLTYWGKKRW